MDITPSKAVFKKKDYLRLKKQISDKEDELRKTQEELDRVTRILDNMNNAFQKSFVIDNPEEAQEMLFSDFKILVAHDLSSDNKPKIKFVKE